MPGHPPGRRRAAVLAVGIVLLAKAVALAVIGQALLPRTGAGGAAALAAAAVLGTYGVTLGAMAVRGEIPRWLRRSERGTEP